MTTQRVAVVGAGVAGLTCAYRVRRTVPGADVVVFEASGRPGGKVRTSEIAGRPVDEAVDGFVVRVPAAVDLCRELGLGDRLVAPVAGGAAVWRDGRLHPFPAGSVLGVPTDLDALRASGVVSVKGAERAAQDLTAPADGPPAGTDETVGSLVRRRLGDEVFEALVAPLLSGINAGGADALSLAAGAPQLAAARDAGPASLIEALRRQLDAAPRAGTPVFNGLAGGSQQLTDALAAAVGDVRTGHRVTGVVPIPAGGFDVDVVRPGGQHEPFHADAVVLAVPSFAAAPLVETFAGDLAAGLATLEWSSVALVTLAAPRAGVDHPLDISGFLVAHGEGLLMTACSFGSTKWDHWRDPAGDDADRSVILRVSAGRHPDRRALDLDDADLVAHLADELRATIGLRVQPVATRVSRWERSLPQYTAGHLVRARRWKDQAGAHAGLFLTGASYYGLGVPAVVADAEQTAGAVAAHLRA